MNINLTFEIKEKTKFIPLLLAIVLLYLGIFIIYYSLDQSGQNQAIVYTSGAFLLWAGGISFNFIFKGNMIKYGFKDESSKFITARDTQAYQGTTKIERCEMSLTLERYRIWLKDYTYTVWRLPN